MSDYIKHKDTPIFEALYQEDYRITKSSSVTALPASLTINSSTQTPFFRYKGEDATDVAWNAWGYGPNLVTFGSGALPTANVMTPIENGLQLNAGKAYKAAGGDTTSCAITTEDFVLEYVTNGTRATGYLTGKVNESTNFWGAYLGASARFWIANATTVTVISDNLFVVGFNHIMMFADRSGFGQIYVNGVASGAPVQISALSGTLNTAGVPFTLGCQSGGAAVPTAVIVYAAGWKADAWLDTHLQATVASNRFKLLTGSNATIATGTSSSTFTRSFVDGARVLKAEGGNYNNIMLGSNWIRKEPSGYLIEPSAANVLPAVEVSGWSREGNVKAPAYSTSVFSPFTGKYSQEVIASATGAGNCDFYYGGAGSIPLGSKVVGIMYIKPNQVTSVKFARGFDINYTYQVGYTYDLTGAGSLTVHDAAHPPTSGFISNIGNGWYKCMFYIQAIAATSSSIPIIIWSQNAADTTTPQFYMSAVNMFVVDHAPINIDDHPSVIYNSAVAVTTRPADVLYYKADDGNFNATKGTIEFDFTLPTKPTSSTNRCQYPNYIPGWTKTGSPTETLTTGPEGLANAYTVTTTGSTKTYYMVYSAGTAVANVPIALGFHFKKSAGDTGYVGIGATSSAGATGYWSINLSLLSDNWTWIDRTNISTYGSVPNGNEFYSASNGSSGLVIYGDLSSPATPKTFSIANITAQNNGTFNILKGDGLLSVSKSGLKGNSLELSMNYDGYVQFTEKNSTNLLANSTTYNTPAWNKRGGLTATDNTNETLDPLGGNTASKITGGQDMYQVLTFISAYSGTPLGVGVWIKRISTSGIFSIQNPANNAAGNWSVNLANLPDTWVRLTATSPYITQVVAFSVFSTYVGGLMFIVSGGLSFYLWNAELEFNVTAPAYDIVNNSGCQFTSISGSTNYADGLNHTAKLSWYGANANLYVDGTLQGSTSSLVVPSGLDRIYCGSFGDGSVVSKKWIKNIRSYNY
jgi:hypothetical protein